MDSLYFDTFGTSSSDDEDSSTEDQCACSFCREMHDDVPCADCVNKCEKLCKKCRLPLELHDSSERLSRSTLELVFSQYQKLPSSYVTGRELSHLGLSRLTVSRRSSTDQSSSDDEEDIETINEAPVSLYDELKRRQYEEWMRLEQEVQERKDMEEQRKREHRQRVKRQLDEQSKNEYREWSRKGYKEWYEIDHGEWYEKGYGEWDGRQYRGWFERGYNDQLEPYDKGNAWTEDIFTSPCVIRSTRPGIDHDEPRYVAEVWSYVFGKRLSRPHLMLYAMQPASILALPYGSRTSIRRRRLYLEDRDKSLWSTVSSFASRTYQSCVAVARRTFGRGPTFDQELD
ncbi:hypothetical protein GGR54DRAFT_102188 [Hypoxylon sp. NC1633]|nr:hypothetical protein GGR54DRAFT_102188 [Hypoxylon sp. NC1633]